MGCGSLSTIASGFRTGRPSADQPAGRGVASWQPADRMAVQLRFLILSEIVVYAVLRSATFLDPPAHHSPTDALPIATICAGLSAGRNFGVLRCSQLPGTEAMGFDLRLTVLLRLVGSSIYSASRRPGRGDVVV